MNEQPFLSCPAIRSFRNTHELEIGKSQLGQFAVHLVDLAEATIDEQHVGLGNFARLHALVAALERLPQGAVIIAGRNAGDIERSWSRRIDHNCFISSQ